MIWALLLLAGLGNSPNPHGPNLMIAPDNDSDFAAMTDFVSCLVDKYPDRSKRFLDSFPFAGDQNKLVAETIPWQCLKSGTLKMSPVQLRGAIAREWLQREHPVGKPSFDQRNWINLGVSVAADDAELKSNFVSLYRTAECVARKAPAETEVLVRSRHGDETERAAYSRLLPIWASCEPDRLFQNPTVYGLKGVESEMLYRLYEASRSLDAESATERPHA